MSAEEINLEEAAKILRKSEPDVMAFVQSGRLSHRYANGQCLLLKSEVQALGNELDHAKLFALLREEAILEYRRGIFTLEEAAHHAGTSEEEFAEILKNTPQD